MILIPLIYTQALPKAMLTTLLVAPPPPPPPPPPPAAAPTIVKPVARLLNQGVLTQPKAIPKQVAVFKEAELPPEAVGGGVAGGIDLGGGGILGGLGWSKRRRAAAAAATAAAKADGSDQGRRQRARGHGDRPSEPSLSAFGAAGSHSGQRCAACDHRQRWQG